MIHSDVNDSSTVVSDITSITKPIFLCRIITIQKSAYKWAKYLCSNKTLKSELDKTKFRREIEGIIRRPGMIDEEENNQMTPCPITGQLISEIELENSNTKDFIPMCICTGKHMVRYDWCFCPKS